MRKRATFFIQEAPREPWHVESDENCELMLCGRFISVDLSTVRIRAGNAPSRALGCADCWMLLQKRGDA